MSLLLLLCITGILTHVHKPHCTESRWRKANAWSVGENPLLHHLAMYLFIFFCSLVNERSQDICISGFAYQCNTLKTADVASLVPTLSGFWILVNVLISAPWRSYQFPKHLIQCIFVSQVLSFTMHAVAKHQVWDF